MSPRLAPAESASGLASRSVDETIESLANTVAPFARTVAGDPRATVRPSPDDVTAPTLARLLGTSMTSREAGDVAVLGPTLGEGGMALVREAMQRSVGRSVAVKTLRDDDVSPRSTLRLLHEAWVTGALEHPNIVPLYDIALDRSGAPLVLLKRVDGDHWGRLLREESAFRARFGDADPLETHLRLLMQVANAVSHAHRRGIVHRDIKPENVMVGEGGEPYLVDWGIAVSLRDDPTGRLPLAKDARGIAGTLCYLAPEMIGVSEDGLSERTDVYLLGAVLYEIVCGAPPHLAPDALSMLRSALVSEPRIPPSVPEELAAICRHAMSLLPHDRFPSAEAFRDAVARFLSHRASEELSRAAEDSLVVLETAVRDASGEDADRRRVVQRAFAEAHFGFREAARSWPESVRARGGLEAATAAMVRFELDNGDPAAAAGHLAALSEPPAELSARVRGALEADAEAKRRIAELRELGRDHDPLIGRGARIAAMGILGAAFTFSPAINWLRGVAPSYRGLFTAVVAFLILSTLVVYAGRRELLATALNRRLVGSLFVTLGTQAFLHGTAYVFGLPAEASQLMQFCIWLVVSGMLTVFVDKRLWISVATFALGWLATARDYDLRPLLSTIGNGVFALNLIWVWRRSERAQPTLRR